MKYLLFVISTIILVKSLPIGADTNDFDWSGLDREVISLGAPLLIIKSPKGFIGCGYINVDACIDEVCATVSEVNTHDEMLTATISAVSKEAAQLGIHIGMSGAEAIIKIK